MQRRIHPTFGQRLSSARARLICAALACLGLGLLIERSGIAAGLEQVGYLAFLGCAMALPLQAAWTAERQRCPRCRGRLLAAPHRYPDEDVWFTCGACEIEWRTRTVVDV